MIYLQLGRGGGNETHCHLWVALKTYSQNLQIQSFEKKKGHHLVLPTPFCCIQDSGHTRLVLKRVCVRACNSHQELLLVLFFVNHAFLQNFGIQAYKLKILGEQSGEEVGFPPSSAKFNPMGLQTAEILNLEKGRFIIERLTEL